MNPLDLIPFKGYRTYIVGALMILYGVAGLLLGKLDQVVATESIMGGFGLLFARTAVQG